MRAKGIFLTVLSAVFYGLNPLFAKTVYTGGCNSLTLTLSRLLAGSVIFLFLQLSRGGSVSARGVFLALASGVAWACYILHLNSSGLVEMAPFKLAFWLCTLSAVLVGAITLGAGQLALPTTPLSWRAIGLFRCVATAASLLFQVGNKYIGAQSASMLSTFEPLTSVVVGILVYHEVLTVRLGIGILCILLAVLLLAGADEPTEEKAKSEA